MTIEEAFSLLDEMDHSTPNSIEDSFLLTNFLIKDFDNTENFQLIGNIVNLYIWLCYLECLTQRAKHANILRSLNLNLSFIQVIVKELNMITEQEILDAIRTKSNDSDSGKHCIFIPISKRLGYKFYLHETLRDDSAENQRTASRFNLAPKVYGKINVGRFYGFVTQRANIVTLSQTQIGETMNKIRQAGIPLRDAWYKNYGTLDGKTVCVDLCLSTTKCWELEHVV